MNDEKHYVTLSEARKLLEEVNEERELSYEQSLALQHAQKFAKLDPEKTEKMVKELSAIEGVTEYHAVKIAEILPAHPDDVRAIFSGDKIVLQMSQMESILEVVRKYI